MTGGIEGILIETHNWGRTVAFWKALGYELEFETDHHSGQLRHPKGGPYLFIAEVPKDQQPDLRLVLRAPDPDAFEAGDVVEVVTPFEDTHFGTTEATVRDPDGRLWSLQAPAKG